MVEERCQCPPSSESLTILLTTNGGYIETVQRIVDTIRHHYKYVRYVIPNHAFSAGTVLTMSGDSIAMDYYSRLGPIDPQVQTAAGRMVSVVGYLTQYARLIAKANDGTITNAEVSLLIDGFDQGELYHYEQVALLSVSMVIEWLANYKFKDWNLTETHKRKVTQKQKEKRAKEIADQLNSPERWHSHGYGISMDVLINKLNLRIDDYGKDAPLATKIRNYDSLLSDYMLKRGDEGVVHVATSTLEGTYRSYYS